MKVPWNTKLVCHSYRRTCCAFLDPTNDVGARFNGGELPTHVLIDQNGFVRRRFLDKRSLEVWETMLKELESEIPGSR